jgi:hypothetical protein
MMRFTIAPAACLALLLSAGCSQSRVDDYPSLLPRPIEKRGFAEPEPKAPPVVRPDPALDTAIAKQRAALSAAAAAFGTQAERAERLASRARGAAAGSESWIAAQVALAELDTLRGATAGALADIERLAIDRAAKGEPPYPALEVLLADARRQNEGEVARIGGIEASMPRG